MDLSIIIPCFNEAENVPKLRAEFLPVLQHLVTVGRIGSVATAEIEVIFVDDGSKDGTFPALQETLGACILPKIAFRFVQHKVNRGLGAALRSGFAAAQGSVIVTTDCDGTYRFCEIPGLLQRLTPDVDLVTASPYHPDGAVAGVPAYRLLLSRSSSALYRLLVDRHIYTYTALFRAYRRTVIESAPFYADGFLAGTELLVNGLRMGYRVAEYPTVLHSRVYGVSKAKVIRTIKAHLTFQWQSLSPWRPYGLVIRGPDATLYLYEAGCKRAFGSIESFLSHGYQWQQVIQLSAEALATIPNGPAMSFRDGALVRGSAPTVYIIEHGVKRPIVSAPIFEALGYRWQNIMQVSDECLTAITDGMAVTVAQHHPDGTLLRGRDQAIYLLKRGQRCLIPTERIFHSWGYEWEQVVQVSDQQLAQYPLGEAIEAQPTFLQSLRQQPSVFLTQFLPTVA